MSTPTTVITGGAQGIGLAVAQNLIDDGACVALLDANPEALEQARARFAAAGERVSTHRVDVRDGGTLEACLQAITADARHVAGLVTCAGTTRSAPAEAMARADWDLVLDINLTGTFLCCQVFGRAMLARGAGSIVTISSTTGLGGQAGRANYSASKWAVIGLTKTLAIEWGSRGVRVNSVAPGPVDTALYGKVPQAFREGVIHDRIPLARPAQAREIADAVWYLLSPRSSYVNGTVLAVDGGFSSGFLTTGSGTNPAI